MNKKKLFIILTSIILCSALLFSGCKNKDTARENSVIYATIAPVYDFTRKIAGDKQEIKLLVTSDIHDYEPSAAEMAKIEGSPMIIYNGMNLDSFVNNINENLNIKFVDTSIGTESVGYVHNGEYQHQDEHGHTHNEAEFNRYAANGQMQDPHVWLYPYNAKIQLRNIKDALCEYDAENAEYYNANYEFYAAKCDELDSKFKSLAGKNIITSHNAYSYWQEKYGINVMALDTGGEEVSPARMKELVDHCRNSNIHVVYHETGGSNKTAEAVAKEIAGTTRAINSFESIVDNKDDYFTIMEENYQALQ